MTIHVPIAFFSYVEALHLAPSLVDDQFKLFLRCLSRPFRGQLVAPDNERQYSLNPFTWPHLWWMTSSSSCCNAPSLHTTKGSTFCSPSYVPCTCALAVIPQCLCN